MNTISDLILIGVITTIIIDMTDLLYTIKNKLKLIFHIKGNVTLKPFDCSLCMTFWLCIIYLLIYNHLTLMHTAISLLIAVNTPIIKAVIQLFQDITTKIINTVYNHID